MNKKGIELAASLIVILIIAIVVLGLAGSITYKIMCSASDQIETMDAAQQKNVERSLSTGASVVIPNPSKTAKAPSSICGGSSVASASFVLGIRNDDLDGSGTSAFTVSCKYHDNPSDLSSTIDCLDPSSPFDVQFSQSVNVDPHMRAVKTIVVNVKPSSPQGKQMFTMYVDGGGSLKAANFYLTVE